MRAVKLDGNEQVRVVELPDPDPGPGEVVIRTAASALCGSELGGYRGDGVASGNSGHEAAGTVEALGPGVTALTVGQRVGVSAIAGCGTCAFCTKGQYTWCNHFKFYGGMHAERFLAAANACHPLPDDVPWDVGVLITGDGLGVPFHTWTKLRSADVCTVAVFGVGPIGLGSVMLQSFLGRELIAVDVSAYRLERAAALGAAHVVDAAAGDAVARILDVTDGAGVDAAIEAAGRPETARQCFKAVRKGGTVVFDGEQPAVELSPSQDFIRRDITAVGAWFYHFGEYGDMLQLVRDGLPVGDLISHRFPLADAAEAYREFAALRTAKVLLTT